MAIRCPKCGHEYDVTLFQFGRKVVCDCGAEIDLAAIETLDALKNLVDSIEEQETLERLQLKADRISSEILDQSYSVVDIEIHIESLRDEFRDNFPEKSDLFSMIYEARFRRLWEQFRQIPPPF
ncbi:MAG: hypothetical protein HZC17_09095 [Candidatus Omnitrophica bacterium]|nr:hypothetical protein [Candidatus Omnitrophota bacterium]